MEEQIILAIESLAKDINHKAKTNITDSLRVMQITQSILTLTQALTHINNITNE